MVTEPLIDAQNAKWHQLSSSDSPPLSTPSMSQSLRPPEAGVSPRNDSWFRIRRHVPRTPFSAGYPTPGRCRPGPRRARSSGWPLSQFSLEREPAGLELGDSTS
ncbi:hypothetical protein LX36DRAFT_656141 [Colletotrichum falcatum]|nr:hypothetical protein LX36DRAFT_656141 [Colletotrichum falcatum]